VQHKLLLIWKKKNIKQGKSDPTCLSSCWHYHHHNVNTHGENGSLIQSTSHRGCYSNVTKQISCSLWRNTWIAWVFQNTDLTVRVDTEKDGLNNGSDGRVQGRGAQITVPTSPISVITTVQIYPSGFVSQHSPPSPHLWHFFHCVWFLFEHWGWGECLFVGWWILEDELKV
jgi:hypothetical protein